MLIIRYNNCLAYINGPSSEIAEVAHVLTYTVSSARFTPAYQSGRWNGKRSMFFGKYNAFPTGLIPYVKKKLKNIQFIDEDNRNEIREPDMNPIELWGKGGIVELRNYQKEAVDSFLKKQRGIIKISTRGGKTLVAVACTQVLGLRTLFICHTKDLLKQAKDEYEERMRIKAGIIGDSKWEPANITVATIQTLSRRLKNKSTYDDVEQFLFSRNFAIFDEIHRSSESYQIVSKFLKNAPWRLGLSATALVTDKENKLQSMALTADIIYEIKTKKLVDEKHIAKPIVYFIPTDTEWVDGDWDEVYDEGIVNNEDRNLMIAIIAMKELRRGKSSLILVEKLEHGKNLEVLLSNRANVRYVHGRHTVDQRKEALQDIQTGKLDILITSRIFNEGVNIVLLENVIIASGGKSPIQTFQRAGRGITKTEKKDVSTVYDFIDIHNKLLMSHSMERMTALKKDDGYEIHEITLEDV